MNLLRALVVVLVAVHALIAQPQAAQQIPEPVLEYAAAVNLPRQNVKMRAVMALAPDVKSVRCVIWVVHQGAMSEQLYAHRLMRETAAGSNCGLVLASIQRIQFRPASTPQEELNRNVSLGGDVGLGLLVDRFAEDSGHRELRTAPILFWGFSAAADFGTTFATLNPTRTIGLVRYHTHRRDVPVDVLRVKDIPALLVAGALDQTAGVDDADQFWRAGRSAGAPWTFAIEPDAPHSSTEIHAKTLTSLTIPWMNAVLRQRLTPRRTLQPVSNATAWLGDTTSATVSSYDSFVGEKVRAVWLPDSTSAKGWLEVQQGGQALLR